MKELMSSIAVLALTTGYAGAQSADLPANIERLQSMQSTGVKDFAVVEQAGSYADGIKKSLERIEMPDGFKIELYAIVPDARHIAVGPQGVVTFVGTRKDKVWAVTDRNKDRVADEVKDFAPSLSFTIPNGVCFSPDGFLYVAEQNRVLVFPAAEFFYESPDVAVGQVVPQGELIPVEEESYNHTARVCDIGPDGKLYISLGQPHNVTPPDRVQKYMDTGIGGIIRMNNDGTDREIIARGVRNSVGQDFDPATGDLWFTDNQVDGMGDDIPPGEINHMTDVGLHFGHPWFGGGDTRTTEYESEEVPVEVTMPASSTVAHAADLGMVFYTGDMFPAKYEGAIFSAQHGSWNRTTPVGARIVVTTIDDEGNATTEPFAEGWIDENGEYLGRPVDVANLRDGSLLVSDDLAGALYRISYTE